MKSLTKKLSLFILVAPFFTACDNGNNETVVVDDGRVPLVINTGIRTRVVDNTWETGDAIGVTTFNEDYSAILEESLHKKYVTNETLGTFTASSSDHLIYFPEDGSSVRIKSYYPYKSDLGTDHFYPLSLTDQSVLQDIDLMTAEHQSGFTKEDNNVRLHFYHRLSKLVFIMANDPAGGAAISLADTDLTIQGMHSGDTYHVIDDTFLDQTTGIQPIAVPLREGELTDERHAIVLPRTAADGVTFEFAAPDGYTYSAQMSDTLSLLSGYKYIFNITFSRGMDIETMEVTIEDWNDGGEYDLVAE